jgi:glycosyltransferase involved in cell wall biosynthesis
MNNTLLDLLERQLVEIDLQELNNRCKYELIGNKDHILYPFLFGRYAFMDTEILPENDIHLILDCFTRKGEYPLVAIGNWRANAYAEALIEKYAQNPTLILLNFFSETRLLNMFRNNCYVYIDSNHQPNYRTSLIEAMYMQLPIIAYASSYNVNLTSKKALLFKNSSELLFALKSLHPTKAAQMGLTLRAELEIKMKQARPLPIAK